MDNNTVFLIGICFTVYILFATGMLWVNRNMKNDKCTFNLLFIILASSFITGIVIMGFALSN